MESRTKNKQTRAQIEAMAQRTFGQGLAAGEDAVAELKEGWFNAAYSVRLADGREVILKIAPPPGAEVMQYEQNIMRTDLACMKLVREDPAIPVPAIYGYDDARDLCDADYFFMQKLDGDNLDHVKAGLPPAAQTAIDEQIGRIVRAINGFPGVYFGYDGSPALRAPTWREAFVKIMDAVLDDGARKQVVYDFSYEALRAAVHKHAPALEEVTTPCLVHWDAWNPNFFVRDGRVTGIIDFERALWAEPLLEAQFRRLGDEGAAFAPTDAVRRGYGKTTFTPAEEQRNHLYDLHLALVMNTECYYRNYDTDFVFNFSRTYLAATMAWLEAN
jgi:aminoglycoside phosphotransferase (APT) family kinase protein